MIRESVKHKFKEIFGSDAQILLRSPGRINLIGEHTDYNGGFVLPAAIDKSVYFAVSPRADRECRFYAHDLNAAFNCNLDALEKTEINTWANYLMGVLSEIQKALPDKAMQLRGIDLVFGADLPSGGGLSSSAAIENGIGFAVNELFDLGLSRIDLVEIAQKAENNFVGMKCGIMDMFASMMGFEDQFIKIDCRSLDYQYYPFHSQEYCFVLFDSMVKHALVDSEYNTRRRECEEGLRILQQQYPQLRLLRDVPMALLESKQSEMSPVVYQRCKYVIGEIERVEKACAALEQDDFEQVGKLMYETHEGLSRAYEVSCPELDFLVTQTRSMEAVLGSRMMGGGFGGCSINLISADQADQVISNITTAYLHQFGKNIPHYRVKPAQGTEIIK